VEEGSRTHASEAAPRRGAQQRTAQAASGTSSVTFTTATQRRGKGEGGHKSCKERNQGPDLRIEGRQKHGRQNEKRQSMFQ